MGMKQTLDVINRMEVDGIIGRYAIAGAVAAYNYVGRCRRSPRCHR